MFFKPFHSACYILNFWNRYKNSFLQVYWKRTHQLVYSVYQHTDKTLMKYHGWQNPLHRKKLHLALHCLRGSPTDPYLVMAGALDTAWVLRWLDDAGLPQHKDTFLAARVDGRLLHRLTLEELAGLHVTSVLHAASIRTGIQVCARRHSWL